MKPSLRQRINQSSNNRRRLIQGAMINEEVMTEPLELWKRYRPIQGFLDSLRPTEKEQLLQSGRESVLRILRERFESNTLELRGDTLYPLGLVLD